MQYYNPTDSTRVSGKGVMPSKHHIDRINSNMIKAGRTAFDGGYYQQGGAIEDLRINEETMLEALFRYFQAKGIPEEELFDGENINPKFIGPATEFLSMVENDSNF